MHSVQVPYVHTLCVCVLVFHHDFTTLQVYYDKQNRSVSQAASRPPRCCSRAGWGLLILLKPVRINTTTGQTATPAVLTQEKRATVVASLVVTVKASQSKSDYKDGEHFKQTLICYGPELYQTQLLIIKYLCWND